MSPRFLPDPHPTAQFLDRSSTSQFRPHQRRGGDRRARAAVQKVAAVSPAGSSTTHFPREILPPPHARRKEPAGRRARNCECANSVSVADLQKLHRANLGIVATPASRGAQIARRSPFRGSPSLPLANGDRALLIFAHACFADPSAGKLRPAPGRQFVLARRASFPPARRHFCPAIRRLPDSEAGRRMPATL